MLRLMQTLCLTFVIYSDCRFLFLFYLYLTTLVPLGSRISFQGRPGKVRQQQKHRGAKKTHRERNVWPKSSKMYIKIISTHPKGGTFWRAAKLGMLFQVFLWVSSHFATRSWLRLRSIQKPFSQFLSEHVVQEAWRGSGNSESTVSAPM